MNWGAVGSGALRIHIQGAYRIIRVIFDNFSGPYPTLPSGWMSPVDSIKR